VSPYSWDRDATGWYQSPCSHTFSTASLQVNVGLICNWVIRVVAIHSNYKYKVIYFFLEIHPLIFEISCNSLFPSPIQPARIWKDGRQVTVLALPVTVRTGERHDEDTSGDDEEPAAANRALVTRIVDCTPGAEAGYCVEFQEVAAGRLFGH